MTDPKVLYEDNHCLAVAKPAPLLMQGVPYGPPTLEAWAREYLRTTYNKPGNVYLGVPHRLDRPVSGVALFTKSSKAAARLADQFRHHQVTKVYWALVDGDAFPAEGTWEDHVRKVTDQARGEVVAADVAGAKPAVTNLRSLCPLAGGVLVEMRPRTGRMHQLRLQAANRGWPIRGDDLYGSTVPFGAPAELQRERVIALHARSLTFLHPIRYEPMTVVAELPDYWPQRPGNE